MDASQILEEIEESVSYLKREGFDGIASDLSFARDAVATMSADLTEARAEIAALRGLPEGAVSEGWAPTVDREAWVRRLPRSPHDHLLARHDNGACSWWVYQPNDRRKGTAPTLRDAMRAADKAAGVAL